MIMTLRKDDNAYVIEGVTGDELDAIYNAIVHCLLTDRRELDSLKVQIEDVLKNPPDTNDALEEVLRMRTIDMPISDTMKIKMVRNCINTVRELVSYTKEEIKNLYDFEFDSLWEIEYFFERNDLYWGMQV